jgi:uncharacterized protein YxjI
LNLFIKQKIFSLKDKYSVYNEFGEPVYQVEGEFLSLGAKIHLYDLNGRELYFIRQKVFTFLPEYEIYQGEAFCARIKKELSFFHPILDVESSWGKLVIEGSFMEMDFSIFCNGQSLGEIHKQWLTWGDTYCLSIVNPDNAAFFTSLVIAIDNCLHNHSKNHS